MPAPVTAEKRTMGAPSRKVPLRASRTSSSTSSSQSSSTRSTLVRTTRPCLTWSSWQISRCSRVWGMTPSSAAMTRATRSMPRGAGHHVAHEALVARHVHDAQALAGGQRQIGKPQLDGDAPELLLLEAVRVDPGQGLDQGALAVVDVAGGA